MATLGTLYISLAPHGVAHAFAGVEHVQMGIVALLAVGEAALLPFTRADRRSRPAYVSGGRGRGVGARSERSARRPALTSVN